ncbi:MAG: histidine phosphatase family protein [Pseudomonadota bacterium]
MQRILTLVRHAKSSWNNSDLNDFERPLNSRGLKNAPEMGKRLADVDFKVDLIISSPAARAITTAELISSELGYNFKRINHNESIYEANLNTLLHLVSSLNDNIHRVLMVGHNPGLTSLCNYLSNAKIENMPTCSITQIQFSVNSWQSINEHSGELLDYDYPKKLKM